METMERSSDFGAGSARDIVDVASLLLQQIADVLPYPILSKFVPALLFERLIATGATVLPRPAMPSPGLRLTRSLETLAVWCEQRGWPPRLLRARWPDVDSEVSDAVWRFCADHAGFGPVAWEAPGFDDPRYVLQAMDGLGSGQVSKAAIPSSRLEDLIPAPGRPLDLQGVLAGWLEFIELQIWYVRSAFYRGLVPLLIELGRIRGWSPVKLLFLSRHEISGACPSGDTIDRRIELYLRDVAYLRQNSADVGRLDALFDARP